MTQWSDITALVLSAGYSSRMDQFKPLLPVGPVTALERCVRLFQDAGVRDVRVVVGHRASELQPVLDRLAVPGVMNERFAEGMFSSVQAGVKNLQTAKRAFFLLPVDIPLVRRTTILDLLATSTAHSEGILIPSFLDKRGHPPLISTKWSPEILSWEGDGGLRAFLSEHSRECLEIPVADEHILMDMDTPDEYERLLAAITDYEVPSASECMVLLTEKFQVPDPIVAHASTVAQVALRLARALTKRGLTLNLKLIVAAALLHDLAKGKPNHAVVAAAALRDLGYPAVADIVAEHMDPQPQSGVPISAQEVVCFADKVVEAETIMSVEKRFGKKIEDCGENPVLAHVLKQRLSNILRLQARLESALGSPIETALQTSFADCGED